MEIPSKTSKRSQETERLLKEGILAARSGNNARALDCLYQVVAQDERNAQAWYWLSVVVESLDEVKLCLENVLVLEPVHQAAAERLAWINQTSQSLFPAEEPESQAAQPAPAPHWSETLWEDLHQPLNTLPPRELSFAQLEHLLICEPGNTAARVEWLRRTQKNSEVEQAAGHLETQVFTCPQCGGSLGYEPGSSSLLCGQCGFQKPVESALSQPPEKILALGFTKSQGQSWSDTHQVLRCQQCGAQTIFPAAQVSVICPYCDNAAFVAVSENKHLEIPQAMIPMLVEPEIARQKVKDWLGHSLLAPAGLAKTSIQKMTPLYIPLWLFNSALQFKDPYGESLLNKRDFIYNDWPVPGISYLPVEVIQALQPFYWEKLAAFSPEYLARFPATFYEVPVDTASQIAYRGMREDARSKLPLSITDPGAFYGQSYKLVLFPVWISTFKYGGKLFHVIVNGQTGKVTGSRPVDWGKVGMATAAAALLVALLVLGLAVVLGSARQELVLLIKSITDSIGSIGIILFPAVGMLLLLIFMILRE
jgi:Zn finger protein HypA/HybF involved in hydrogenase expression